MSNPTPDQQCAIDAVGDTLVVAGAGAGKTRTLVDRVCALTLREEDPVAIDRILMVTFTDAAAAEMRSRIRERLEKHLRECPTPAVERQLALLDSALVGTLHGFCFQLVREHFYELGLDPVVIVMDDADSKLLAAETLDELLDLHYAGKTDSSAAVRSLIHDHARGDDRPIRSLILGLHNHAQSLPDPEGWLAEQMASFEKEGAEAWIGLLLSGFSGWREQWIEVLGPHAGENPNAAQCLAALSEAPVPTARETIAATSERIIEIGKSWPKGQKGRLEKPIKKIFDEARFLHSLSRDPRALEDDWNWSRLHMQALLGLAREFEISFSRAKREQAAADFADLEQFALRLLWDRDRDSPTEVAQEWRERLEHVFVDECQDINAAQDRIIQAVSRDRQSANRFLVGDVKQSIYRFRQADPRIFQNRSDDWRSGRSGGQTLPLADNFRSHEGILDFVNELFIGLMRREIGGVEFDRDAFIRFGAPEQRRHFAVKPGEPPRVELHVQLTGKSDGGDHDDPDEDAVGVGLADLSRVEKEARMVGLRLRELRETGFKVWDEELNDHRDVDWRDMVVLLRSPGAKAESYAKEFSRLGVPVETARGGFYDATEVGDFLSLLMTLDNPLQDIPLLAVLRSPLVGLSLNELTVVRLSDRKAALWFALKRFHRLADPDEKTTASEVFRDAVASAQPKVARFLESHARWRELAREGSLSHCLESAIDETCYEDWLTSRERGAQRRANLNRFLAQARRFDQFQRQGLFRFLRHIEAQRDNDVEPDPAGADASNAVRLVSIHRSKGLEFPVVALSELGGSFNFADLRGDIVLDEELGLCPRVIPPGGHRAYPSLPHWLAGRRQRAELLGEEMRLLYVATTRAKDLLVLGGSASRKTVEEKWGEASPELPSVPELLKANRFLDWLGPAFRRLTGDAEWTSASEGVGKRLSWRFVESEDLSPGKICPADPKRNDVPAPADATEERASLDALIERISWTYPHEEASRESAKASVTGIRRRLNEDSDEDALPLFRMPRTRFTPEPGQRLGGGSKLSAAEIGNAHHAFQQHVALDRAAGEEGLRGEARRLVDSGQLSEAEVESLNFGALLQFWESDLGVSIRENSTRVYRELPFTARFSPAEIEALDVDESDLAPGSGEDFIVVQGAVDLAVIHDEAIEIVDFKTDGMKARDLGAKRALYEPQIRLYARALTKVYRKPVQRAALHFLTLGRTVDVIAVGDDDGVSREDPNQMKLGLDRDEAG